MVHYFGAALAAADAKRVLGQMRAGEPAPALPVVDVDGTVPLTTGAVQRRRRLGIRVGLTTYALREIGLRFADSASMTANQTWRAARLEQLRRMLCRVVDEREAINAIDPVKAAHLRDAAVDLQTLINRIEDGCDDAGSQVPLSTAEPRKGQRAAYDP